MTPARINGCTRALGAPRNWDQDRDGACGVLPIRDEPYGRFHRMVSAWEPTPAELAALAAGAKVYLSIVGDVHPPVALYVDAVPEPEA